MKAFSGCGRDGLHGRVICFLMAAMMVCSAASAAMIDDFEGKQSFSMAPGSIGQAKIVAGQGASGTHGLLFEAADGIGRITVGWGASLSTSNGIVFKAYAQQSGVASIQLRCVEKDGDLWVAWYPVTTEWRGYGAAFTDLEYVPSGDGKRSPKSIQRLEMMAVLQDAAEATQCYVDEVEFVAAKAAHESFVQPEYVRVLSEALAKLPLASRQPIASLQQTLEQASSSSPEYQLALMKKGAGNVLAAVTQEALARTMQLRNAPPSESIVSGRTAVRVIEQSQGYMKRVLELQKRWKNYELSNVELEQALLYSTRLLQMLQIAEDLRETAGAQASTTAPTKANGLGAGSRVVRELIPGGVQWPLNAQPFVQETNIPADWSGRRIVLAFEAAGHMTEVLVNGTFCGSHVGGFAPFEIDITKAVRPGSSNRIEIFVEGSEATAAGLPDTRVDVDVYPRIMPGPGPNTFLTLGGLDGNDAGIWGPVRLEARSSVAIEHVAIETSVRQDMITARFTLRNASDQPRSVEVQADVNELSNQAKVLELPKVNVVIEPGQTSKVELSTPWKNYKPWGPAEPYGTPHLYQLNAQIVSDGAVLDLIIERFGFREFEIRSTGFYLNGERIQLVAGTARKPNSPVNMLRITPRIPAQILSECDRTGTLCVVESPIVGMVDVAPPDLFGLDDYADPLWRGNASAQLSQWALGHINNPSVIMRVSEKGAFGGDRFWAHGGGAPSQARKLREAMEAAFEFDKVIRSVDATRPIIHLDNGYADGDRRFEVCAWPAPFPSEDWRIKAYSRPVIAEIVPPVGKPMAAEALENWMTSVVEALKKNDVSAIFLPEMKQIQAASRPLIQATQPGPESRVSGPGIYNRTTQPQTLNPKP